MNLRCLLPDYCIAVGLWMSHPCGGYYLVGEWCWGPKGRIGMRLPEPGR